MSQIVRMLPDAYLIAVDHPMTERDVAYLKEAWRREFPELRLGIVPEAEFVDLANVPAEELPGKIAELVS